MECASDAREMSVGNCGPIWILRPNSGTKQDLRVRSSEIIELNDGSQCYVECCELYHRFSILTVDVNGKLPWNKTAACHLLLPVCCWLLVCVADNKCTYLVCYSTSGNATFLTGVTWSTLLKIWRWLKRQI